ncbi:MAG: hypothetical protein JKY65_14385 [Planctomycetes bacterium]|nr:hypothetical protein [Planctomycetota bacterium]
MIVNFECEFCGKGQSVPTSKAGKTVPCRFCGGDNQIPAAPAERPPSGRGQAIGGPVAGGGPTAYHPAPDAFRPPPERERDRNPYSAPQADLGGGHQRHMAGPPPEVNNAATTAIILAALSWAICALFAPFALWQATRASNLALQHGVKTPTSATVAKVLSIIQIILLGLVFCLVVVGETL